jgi:hypothetical protein
MGSQQTACPVNFLLIFADADEAGTQGKLEETIPVRNFAQGAVDFIA